MKKLLGSALALMVSCSAMGSQELPLAQISLVHLIANGKEFDGKLIAVTGFLDLAFESEALYLHREDFLNALSENSVRLRIGRQNNCRDETLDQKYVTVVGVFHMDSQLRAGRTGRIDEIQRCVLWSDPANPFRKKTDALRKK